MAKRPLATECYGRGLAVVFASFLVHLLITAITRCTGVLFSTFQNEFASTAAQTGAISSIMSASSFFGCTVGGVLERRLGCRVTAVIGGLLNIVGMIGGALTRNIYHMYATGAIAGLGTGVAYTPAVVIVAQYFTKNYSIAAAFMTMGDSVGIMIFGPLMQLLLDKYGWRGTLLVTGAITANICVAGALCKSYRLPGARKRRNDRSLSESDNHGMDEQMTAPAKQNSTNCAVRSEKTDETSSFLVTGCLTRVAKVFRLSLLWESYRFSVFCFAQSTHIFSLGCFVIYLVPYATTSGVSQQRAAFLLSVVGIGGLVGRPLCGLVNQKVPSVIIYNASMLVCGCAALGVQFGTYGHFVVSSAVFGFAIGCQRTIAPVLMREYVGMDNLGSAVGLSSGIGGVADLIGPILAGALYDATVSYTILFYVLIAGGFFAGFLTMLLTPSLKRIEPCVYTKVNTEGV